MVSIVIQCVIIGALAFTFGVALKISDLLQDDGFRWGKRRGLVAFGAICTALIMGILLQVDVGIRIFWLAVVIHWILRARIDGVNHGLFATTVLVYLLVVDPLPLSTHVQEFVYFFGLLSALGLLHDLFQYTKAPAPKWLKWFFANQHLYWYMVGLGYLALFDRDYVLLANLVAFVKGYGVFYQEKRYPLLKHIGISRPDPALVAPAAAAT
jgi:hypothetical protein